MKPYLFTIFSSFIFAASVVLDARTVRIAGSDYIPQALVDALQEFADERGDELRISMWGSLLAQVEFEKGNVDLGLIAMPHQTPEDFSYPVLPLGYQISVLAVNDALPVDSLNRRQIAGIFGATGDSAIARWSDLGLPGAWRGRNIQAGYTNPSQSPALHMFRSIMLNNEPFRSGVQQYDSNVRLESFISNNESAIGLLSTVPLSGNLKTLRIESSDGGVAFGPTVENVNFGDYPLSLPYYISVPLSQYRSLAPYIRFLLSDEVAELLQNEGFIPLLGSIRESLIAELPQS